MLSNKLPRDALLRIYKSFVRSHLDYGDDKPNNESFASRLEWVQYKACLAITGAIQGTSRERLYKELGLESLSDRRWVPKLTFFYKIVKGTCPQYLSNYLKEYNNSVYNTVLFENWKKCHDIWKKGPDCVHLWVTFSIQNLVLRFLGEKTPKCFPEGPPSLVFLRKYLLKLPSSTPSSAPIPPRPVLLTLTNVWLRTCTRALFFLHNAPS